MKQEGFFQLIQEASEMLKDRSRSEQDLIYAICKLEDDLRAAIILAYQGLYNDQPNAKSTGSR